MAYDKALIAGKLRRWEKYLIGFRLPAWEDIPDFGLYMEQVVDLLKRYLDYMPPELKEEDVVTSSAILDHADTTEMAVNTTEELITSAAIVAGFSRLLARSYCCWTVRIWKPAAA